VTFDCGYHYEKWYWEKVKEEMAWEDQVERELAANLAEEHEAAGSGEDGRVPVAAAD
jgi:hypothetical protein